MTACANFSVHPVKVNPEQLPVKPPEDMNRGLSFLGSLVASYRPDADVPVVQFAGEISLLAAAVYSSFYKHYPLKFNPNVVWLTILHGFGIYVNRNAEALRDKFVTHEGKEKILVNRPDFRYQSPSNDWPSVFPQFADWIEKRTNRGIRELLECNYSNTTATDRACSHIALMDICQQYFQYETCDGCGIPRIELLGTADDWRLLRAKAEGLKQFEKPGESASGELAHFSRWLAALLPALDQFVAAAEGRPAVAFWGSVCNLCGLSGMVGSPVTGWVSVFFPYLGSDSLSPNGRIDAWVKCFERAKERGVERALREAMEREPGDGLMAGVFLNDFPSGLSSAPVRVTWADVGKVQELTFCGGIFAIHQHADGALEPRTGWAVIKRKPQ
jgi:hypothetical protein